MFLNTSVLSMIVVAWKRKQLYLLLLSFWYFSGAMRLTYFFANKYVVSEKVKINSPRFPQESLMFGYCPVGIATLLIGLWHLVSDEIQSSFPVSALVFNRKSNRYCLPLHILNNCLWERVRFYLILLIGSTGHSFTWIHFIRLSVLFDNRLLQGRVNL